MRDYFPHLYDLSLSQRLLMGGLIRKVIFTFSSRHSPRQEPTLKEQLFNLRVMDELTPPEDEKGIDLINEGWTQLLSRIRVEVLREYRFMTGPQIVEFIRKLGANFLWFQSAAQYLKMSRLKKDRWDLIMRRALMDHMGRATILMIARDLHRPMGLMVPVVAPFHQLERSPSPEPVLWENHLMVEDQVVPDSSTESDPF